MNFIDKMVEHFIKLNRKMRRWQRAVSILGAVVVFVTTYALVLPAITLDKETASTQAGMEIAASENEPSEDGTVFESQPEEEEAVEKEAEATEEEASGTESGSQEAENTDQETSEEATSEDASQSEEATSEEETTSEVIPASEGETTSEVAPASEEDAEAKNSEETDAAAVGITENAAVAATNEVAPEIELITEQTQLVYQGEDYKVYADFGEEAKLPVGVELKVREITAESDPEVYQDYYEKTLSQMQDKYDENTKLTFAKFYDISFVHEGAEVEPAGDVKVRIEYEQPVDIAKDASVDTVHFDKNDEEKVDVIDTEVDSEKKVEDKVETEAVKAVEFESDQFSVYGVVGTRSLVAGFVAADGNTYEVTVTYNADAEIPKDASLRLVEYAENSKEYQQAKEKVDELYKEELPADAAAAEEKEAEKSEEESEDDAYFNSLAKEGKPGFSALEISILDSQGNVVEPKSEVKVSITMKSLPKDVDEKDLQQTLEVHHLQEKDGEIQVEKVAGSLIEGSEIAADKNGASIEFVTESFSTYTVDWNRNTQHVVMHFVDDQGNELTGFTYNDQPIDNETTTLDELIPENGMFDLSQLTKEGYSLSNTHVGQFEDMNGNTPTIIRNEVERVSDTELHYWTFNTGNDTSGTTERSFGNGTTHLYLVYNSTEMHGSGGQGGGGGDAPDLGEMGHKKEVKGNDDGTYKVNLSVTGSAKNKENDPKVNVIVVFDTSSSMVSNYIPNSSSKTRLEAAKDELNSLATELLSYNNTKPGSVEMALVTFNRNAEIVPLGDSNWTTSADTYTAAVGTYRNGPRVNNGDGSAGSVNTGVPTAKGTNWAQGIAKANTLMGHDDDLTYVLFITDGAPSQYWPSGQATGTYCEGEGCYLGARDEARTSIGGEGAVFYGLFAYGSTTPGGDYSKDYLGKLVNYGYNSDSAADSYRFNVADNEAFQEALKEIMKTIKMNFAYADVEIDDGITELSTVIFEHIASESFTYKITYRDYTSATEFTPQEIVLTPDSNGNITIPAREYGVLDQDSPGGVKRIQTKEYTVTGADYDGTPGKDVTWKLDIAGETGDDALYMLENGWTYTVSFDIWPSQTSYDLVAALNNGILAYGDDYHYTDHEGHNQVLTFNEYKSQITNTRPYTLLTNTNAKVKYQQVTAEVDEEGNVHYIREGDPKEVPIIYNNNMNLVSQEMPVKKEFKHSINDQDPYTAIRFYFLVDGKYYMSDGTLSDTLVPYTGSGDDITPALHTIGMDLSGANEWTGSIYISPGVIVDERDDSGTGEFDVLETGHNYSLYEVITQGSVYEYEFTTQTVRPMVVNGSLQYLIMEDKYNKPAAGAKTYEIDGVTYFEAAADAQALIGTNRKTGELDITKIVNDPDDLMTQAEENAETFTYRVTLKIPDKYPNGSPVDPAGIVGYEYVQRTQDNAYTLYGYQTTDDPANRAFPEDVTKFSGKKFRAWNTLIYRDLVEWANVDGKIISVLDDDGNIQWKIPADADGYHTVTYDMTLKQDEVIRFNNLPSGTVYTIQEIYANKYPADNAGGKTDGRAPVSDPSNIADEGYEISRIQHTGGTASGDTITGTMENPDTRYYNQFTNTVKTHKKVRAELKVKKSVEGYDWLSEYYRFTLAAGECTYTDAEGGTGTSPMPDGTADSAVSIYNDTPDHTLSFGTIPYERPGEYTYTITEAWAESYIEKPGPATIKVTVEAGDDGKLTVTNIEGTGKNTVTTFTAATEETLATGLTEMTNKIKPTEASAKKEWLKADNTVMTAPPAGTTVTFQLYKKIGEADPVSMGEDYQITLDGVVDENGETAAWTATWTDLPAFVVETVEDEEGQQSRVATPIVYMIGEDVVPTGFEKVTDDPVANGGTIQNKQLAREVKIQKRKQDAVTPLAGAKFDLYTKEGYDKTPKDAPIKTNLESLATEGKEGVIELGELVYGNYVLVETFAPDGFILLTDPIDLRVEANRVVIIQGGTMRTDDDPDDTIYQAFITNNSGNMLPKTGGPGTFIYTLGGLALIMASALMYGFRMRRRERRLN